MNVPSARDGDSLPSNYRSVTCFKHVRIHNEHVEACHQNHSATILQAKCEERHYTCLSNTCITQHKYVVQKAIIVYKRESHIFEHSANLGSQLVFPPDSASTSAGQPISDAPYMPEVKTVM